MPNSQDAARIDFGTKGILKHRLQKLKIFQNATKGKWNKLEQSEFLVRLMMLMLSTGTNANETFST